MIGTADVAKAVVALWSSSGLDAIFKAYWEIASRTKFLTLVADEGEGQHPFPYCIFEIGAPTRAAQMSDGNATLRVQWDVPLMFRVHAKKITGGNSARVVAATLMEEISKVYGGHPTMQNTITGVSLDYGNILGSQITGDFAIREDLENVAWQMNFSLRTDVPAAQ